MAIETDHPRQRIKLRFLGLKHQAPTRYLKPCTLFFTSPEGHLKMLHTRVIQQTIFMIIAPKNKDAVTLQK